MNTFRTSLLSLLKTGAVLAFATIGFVAAPHAAMAGWVWVQDETCYENYDRDQDMWVTDCYYGPWYEVWEDDPPPPPPPPPPEPEPIPFPVPPPGPLGSSGETLAEACQYIVGWSSSSWQCVTINAAEAEQVIRETYDKDYLYWADWGTSNGMPEPVISEYGSGMYYNSWFCGEYRITYIVPEPCTVSNACGTTASGYRVNGGSCMVTTPPLPATYGNACTVTSPANACGQTTGAAGTIGCNGSCSASTPAAPANPSYYGQSCSFTSAPNACGQTTSVSGTYGCSGSCSVSTPAAPANPALYGQGCSRTSAPDACGNTNTTYGTYGCDSTCSAAIPVTPTCTPAGPPTIPTFSYLYNASATTYLGSSAPAYVSDGYRVYMNATDPNGDDIAIYYQFYNAQTGAYFQSGWSSPTWVASGSWTYTLSLQNAGPGTYYVQAYSYDGALSSAWSAWQPITLTANAISASCSATPSSGSTSDTYTWSATASGGSGTGYSYTWSGTGLTGKTGQTTTSTYSSGGSYPGYVTVTDSVGNTTGSVACSVNGTPGGGVNVQSAPTVTLSPATQTVNVGGRASFTWSSTNASSCQDVASPPAFANGPTSGSGMTGPLSSGGSYQVRCVGPSGTGYSNLASVNVVQPAAYITAQPKRVKKNAATNLSWSAQNVTSCSVTGTDGYNSGALAGPTIASTTVARTITAQTTFTFSCPTEGVTSSVIVDVLPDFIEF